MAAAMMHGNNRTRHASRDPQDYDCTNHMPFAGSARCHNWLARHYGRDDLTLRSETGGLPGFECQQGVPLQCHNLYAAFGAGYQAKSVACTANGTCGIGEIVRGRADDVIAGADGDVGMHRQRIESHRS
jgi:hypothetical protein